MTRAETPELTWTTMPPAKSRRAQIPHPAAHSPDPVGQGIIDEGRPEDRKDQKGGKFHPFRKGADDQGRRDDGEHA